MGRMSEIHAAMTDAGQIAAYEGAVTRRDELTAEIDALRSASFADDAEYDRQMADLHWLQVERRTVNARISRTFNAYAGMVARSEVAA